MRRTKILFLILSLSLIWTSKVFALPDWYMNPSTYAATSLKSRIDVALHFLTENSKAIPGQVRTEFDYLKEIIQREMSLQDPSLTGQDVFLVEEEVGLYRSASAIIFERLSEIYDLNPSLVSTFEVQSLMDLASNITIRKLYSFALDHLILLPSQPGFSLYELISDRFLEAGNYIGAAFYLEMLKQYSKEYKSLSEDKKNLFDQKSEFCLKKAKLGMDLVRATSYGRIPFLLENAVTLFFSDDTAEALASNPIEKMWDIIDEWIIEDAIVDLKREIFTGEKILQAEQEKSYFYYMGDRLAKVRNQKKLNKAIKSIEEFLIFYSTSTVLFEEEHPSVPSFSVVRRAAILLGCIGNPVVSDSLIKVLDGNDVEWWDRGFEESLLTASAIDALVHIGKKDPVTVELLILALRDKNFNRVNHAAIALGKIKNPRAVEPLISFLIGADLETRSNAIKALAKIGGERAAKALAAVLIYDENSSMRALAAQGLFNLKNQATTEILIFSAENDDERSGVRTEAIRALGELHNTQTINTLIRILEQGDDIYVRGWAAMALAGEQDEKVQTVLKKAAKNSNAYIHSAAERALQGDKDYSKL